MGEGDGSLVEEVVGADGGDGWVRENSGSGLSVRGSDWLGWARDCAALVLTSGDDTTLRKRILHDDEREFCSADTHHGEQVWVCPGLEGIEVLVLPNERAQRGDAVRRRIWTGGMWPGAMACGCLVRLMDGDGDICWRWC